MPANAVYTVSRNEKIAKDVFKMQLVGPTDAFKNPGQFVNISIDGFYLRRPISVCRWNEYGFEIIYKTFGKGTARLSGYGAGTELDILTGLGNGFDISALEQNASKQIVLIGGGVGTPPLFGLAVKLIEKGITPKVILGFATEEDAFYYEEFAELGCEVYVCIENIAKKRPENTKAQWNIGRVTDVLDNIDYDYYYTCGPMGMLKAVYTLSTDKGAKQQKEINGQISFEERMGCGFGACMGCSCKTLLGSKRVCEDGPVFSSKEVIF